MAKNTRGREYQPHEISRELLNSVMTASVQNHSFLCGFSDRTCCTINRFHSRKSDHVWQPDPLDLLGKSPLPPVKRVIQTCAWNENIHHPSLSSVRLDELKSALCRIANDHGVLAFVSFPVAPPAMSVSLEGVARVVATSRGGVPSSFFFVTKLVPVIIIRLSKSLWKSYGNVVIMPGSLRM